MPDQKPILVVGSINMDLVARSPHIARAGETIIGSGFVTTPGGKGANQAVAIARLEHPVSMIGMVGDDVFGAALLENLRSAGVATAAVATVTGPSGIAQIQVADNGQNSIVVVPGANAKVDPDFINGNEDLIAAAGMVLLQLEIPSATIERVVELCVQHKIPVMLDPAPAASLPDILWKSITWLTPNEAEASFYAPGIANSEDIAANLLSKGIQGVVLKRGAEGALVATRAGSRWVPAFKVKAIDTVAAGDCFNGAFAVALSDGRTPEQAARFAAAAAALSVTRKGAQTAMPTRTEVEEFLTKQA